MKSYKGLFTKGEQKEGKVNHNMKLLFMMILCGVFAGGLTLSLTGCGKLFRRLSPDLIPDSDHVGEKDAGEALYGDPLDFE